jgi:hypothetical protein
LLLGCGSVNAPLTTDALERLTRERLTPGATGIALGALALSLLLAFRRERLPPPAAPSGEPRLPEPLRLARLFRLEYGLTFEQGRLRPSGRKGRQLALETASGQVIAWRPPDAAFPPPREHRLDVLAAGGRAVATVDRANGRVVLHEADLAQLHGLGRRGRGLILWPLVLATTAYAALAHRVLGSFLARDAGLSAQERRLSLFVSAAFFALGELAALVANLAIVSAVLRRVRRAQLRRRYESGLRAFLSRAAEESTEEGARAPDPA